VFFRPTAAVFVDIEKSRTLDEYEMAADATAYIWSIYLKLLKKIEWEPGNRHYQAQRSIDVKFFLEDTMMIMLISIDLHTVRCVMFFCIMRFSREYISE
jgi:hypothetical protein